jgi:hypothetical protein
LDRWPADSDLCSALASHCRGVGRLEEALGYARRLVEARPGDPGAKRLLDQVAAERAAAR